MTRIFSKWVLSIFLISLVPIALLGASPGGIALSPLILITGLIVGAALGSLHCSFISIKSGSKDLQFKIIPITVVLLSLITWLIIKDPSCSYTEQAATIKISDYVINKKLNPGLLTAPKFNKSDCSYSFLYDGPQGKYEFLFSQFGEIHTWDYAQGEL